MSHYFDDAPAVPSRPATVTVAVPGARFTMRTDRGVFSHGRLDAGTGVLLRRAPAPRPDGRLLDLGCGAGPIALALAIRSPGADVWAVDVNERARNLCAANAVANGIDNLRVAAPGDVPEGVRFDEIWSNPPIHAGKRALHDLLDVWLPHLTPGGHAMLVVHKHLGADSLQRWLGAQGWCAERVTSSRGYRVLCVTWITTI